MAVVHGPWHVLSGRESVSKSNRGKDEEGSGIVKRSTGIEINVGEESPSSSSVSNVTSTEQTYRITIHESHIVVIETLFHSFCRDD